MKKAFNIAANPCAITLMGIIIIGDIILINTLVNYNYDYLNATYIDTAVAICILIMMFGVTTIIISALALAKGNYDDRGVARALKITVIVLVGILAILEFIGDGIVYGILCLIPIGLEITSICVPSKKQPSKKTAGSITLETTDDKIAELKRLKSLHVISDEQYENAITEIVKDLKD